MSGRRDARPLAAPRGRFWSISRDFERDRERGVSAAPRLSIHSQPACRSGPPPLPTVQALARPHKAIPPCSGVLLPHGLKARGEPPQSDLPHRPAAAHPTHPITPSPQAAQPPCMTVPSSPAPADAAGCRHPLRLASTGSQMPMAAQASACTNDQQLLCSSSSPSTRPPNLRWMSSQRATR